ncbi:MAG: cysteine dioxygenase family protein [Desulfobacterales bacterium]
MPDALRTICDHWSTSMEKISGHKSRLAYIREALPDLLLDTSIFSDILNNIIDGADYPDTRKAHMFDNEILLFTDKQRLFSIRMYLWAPGEYTPIHDHNAWGVIGPITGSLSVTRYAREDAGSDETTASLKEEGKTLLTPGQTDAVLPLDNGIHKTGNPGEMTNATINLYGTPVRRTYINHFDTASGKVYKIHAPRQRKRMLASEALRSLEIND